MKSLFRGSALLLVGNILAGVFNYLFQIQAASRLTPAEYGNLNLWMAYLGIALSLGAVIQIQACFTPATRESLKRFCLLALPAALALPMLAWMAGPGGAGAEGASAFTWIAAGAGFLGGILFHSLLGQFQARTWFTGMGAATLLLACVKIGTASASAAQPSSYYLAFPVSFGAACVLLAAAAWLSVRTPSVRAPSVLAAAARTGIRPRELGASGLLALTLALAPQIDFLNLSASQPASELGRFAQAALFSKGIYFAALTLLQVSLPLHLQSAQGNADAPSRKLVRRIEWLGVLGCALGSLALAAVGPEIAQRVLGLDLFHARTWILLSCLSLTALFRQVQQVQLDCAGGRLRGASIRVAILLAWMIPWRFVRDVEVTPYLVSSLSFYLVLDLGSWILSRKASKRTVIA